MNETSQLWEEALQPGASWSHVLKRHTALRLTDIAGGANVGMLLYNFECPVERYNMPDTLKAQHLARLTKGVALYSDMGRILCSITEDSVGWHDPIGGAADAADVETQYGTATYQDCRNDYYRNSHDSFLVELGKWGLGPRDLTANINFFSRVDVAEDGSLSYHPGNSPAGSSVELRAEMNVLVILNSCPHPLDPSTKYAPKPVTLSVRRVPPPAADDVTRLARPENGRGFTITERYFL